MNATEIGKYFYCKNKDLTEIQIQKLTYYSYVWSMVLNNTKLFDEKPQAWIHGPVFRTLYDSMKTRDFFNTEGYENKFDDETNYFLEMIYRLYGKYSGNQLEMMTHIEEPWKNARKGIDANERSTQELSDEDIKRYYGNLLT